MSERIEIPAEKLHEEMLKLRQGKHMDFLRSLTGMDWGEEGLGVFTKSQYIIELSQVHFIEKA